MFISLCVTCVVVPSEVLSEDGEEVLSSIEPSFLSPNTLKPLLIQQPSKHLHQKCFLLKDSHPWSVRSNLGFIVRLEQISHSLQLPDTFNSSSLAF